MTFSQAYDAAPTEVQDALAFFFKLLDAPQVRAILSPQGRGRRRGARRTRRGDRCAEAALRRPAGHRQGPGRRAREEARRAVDCYRATDGRSGSQFMWKPLGAWCKEIYAAHGHAWTPTRAGNEPKPETKNERTN